MTQATLEVQIRDDEAQEWLERFANIASSMMGLGLIRYMILRVFFPRTFALLVEALGLAEERAGQ